MTLKELQNIVNKITTSDTEDWTVCVETKDTTVEGANDTKVVSASLGFDWDTGKFVIMTEEPLFRQQHKKEVETTTIISRVINGVEVNRCSNCKVEANRTHRYCPSCGKMFI